MTGESATSTLFARRTGRTGGPVVVLLHGWACDGEDMLALADRLAPSCEVLVPDLPGHGRSPVGEGPVDLERMARDVLHLVRETAGEPALWVGHSMGGAVALVAAAIAPHELRAVVALDATWAFRAAGVGPADREEIVRRAAAVAAARSALGVVPASSGCDPDALAAAMASLVRWSEEGPHLPSGVPVRNRWSTRGLESLNSVRDRLCIGDDVASTGHWIQIEDVEATASVVLEVVRTLANTGV